MNPEDINNFLNTPDEFEGDNDSLEIGVKELMDDIGNELVGIRMIASMSSDSANLLERLRNVGFEGMPKFDAKYAHLEGRVPTEFIAAYNQIADQLNNLFQAGSLTPANVKEFEDQFTKVRESFKAA